MRDWVDLLLALPFACLPRRRWDDWNLPVPNVVFASSILTLFGGAALGVTGFFAHMGGIISSADWVPPPLMMPAFFGYVFFTPRGAFSLYLTITGLLRAVAWYVDEPFGDPMLTGVDALVRNTFAKQHERAVRTAREKLERTDEPDRLQTGEWAGVSDATYVVVAARRKPGWLKGTWVITNDGWFTLGEPFDRPTPNGLRTIYPLTLQTATLDVLRKGVSYELPPLRELAPRQRAETPQSTLES